ncbi:MAG: ATP-binding protein [Planctomycetes bacterium]|nr:ATP-binding protein [Planctomycetota bacterium]
MFNRIVTADSFRAHTCFLWGPRQSGKSTLLRRLFPRAPYYDLLRAAEFRRLHADPGLLRQEVDALGWTRSSQPEPIIVDEIQKLPELLDEVHDIVSRSGLRFVLTGSSPRKILRGGGNLLGGRAVRRRLFPLVSAEIGDFGLERALAHGLLPPHYLAAEPDELLTAYVGNYLRDEVMAEGAARNLPAFQRFLEVAALSNGQVVNFTNIAREVGIAANTVRAWFELLVDTLIGEWVPAWRKRAKRRVVESPRFWFFDVGLMNELTHRGPLQAGSPAFGEAFEHFVFMELRAHAGYRGGDRPICYWRTTSGFEVDFVLGDAEFAIEVKSTDSPSAQHMSGLRAFGEEHPKCQRLLVCRVNRARRTDDGIEVVPLATFLRRLWDGEFGGE